MKRIRIWALGAAVCLVLLTACAKAGPTQSAPENTAKELTQPFESKVAIRYKDLEATAHIAKDAPGYCKITFGSPEALQDMAVSFTADQVSVDYKKLHADFHPDSVPGTAMTKLLVSAINTAAKGTGMELSYKDEVLSLSGTMESGTFTMTLDAKNGNLIHLAVPDDDFEASFSDFQFIAQ